MTVELADLPPEKLDFNTKDADGFQIDERGSDQLKYDAYVKMYAEYNAGRYRANNCYIFSFGIFLYLFCTNIV